MLAQSETVRRANNLFQLGDLFGARQVLDLYLEHCPSHSENIEAIALLLRINVERYEPDEIIDIYDEAKQWIHSESLSPWALYHFGIVFVLCEDIPLAKEAFKKMLERNHTEDEEKYAKYGLATVSYNLKMFAQAIELLKDLANKNLPPDLHCLLYSLMGNAYRSLGEFETSLNCYHKAEEIMQQIDSQNLKLWTFYGLATAQVRQGEIQAAQLRLQFVASMTQNTDNRRLHTLAKRELTRLEEKVEVVFDPNTGDILSNRGYITLRGKPILIEIFSQLIDALPTGISKESLYINIWKGDYHPLKHDGLIYSHIQRLRQILAKDVELRELILTAGNGYRINPNIHINKTLNQRQILPIPQMAEGANHVI